MAGGWISNLISNPIHVEPWVLSLFFGTYLILGVAEYMIFNSNVLTSTARRYFVTVPTALITVIYFIVFPELRLLTIAVMTAWGFAKFFVGKVKKAEEMEEKKKKGKYAVR